MMRSRPSRFGWVLVLVLVLWAALVPVAQAQEPRYRYVSVDQLELPPGFDFFSSAAINNSGRVYGTAFGCTPDFVSCYFKPAVYANGTLTVSSIPQSGFVGSANEGGTMGGSVEIDPLNFFFQAALFRGNSVELIPFQQGEIFSDVIALNDSGMALVSSFDADFINQTLVLYQNGRTTPLNFGPTVTNPFFLHLNNQGIISGTTFVSGAGFRGFRFDTRTGQTTLLDPLSTDPHAWALDINNRGDTLGYSFVFGAIERIGVWDRNGVFQPYFVEGTQQFPTISNELRFNDNNQIVITDVSSPASEQGNSYLVPKPGVRLNLADLVENLPDGAKLNRINDINNFGDMIGFGFQGEFLLQRTNLAGSAFSAPHRLFPGLESGRQAARAAFAAKLSRQIAPRSQPLKSDGGALPPSSIGDLLMRRR